MKTIFTIMLAILTISQANAKSYDNPDTIFVARDGSAEFRNLVDAVEVCRAFMTYTKVIFVKKGMYKEKLIIPSWLTNIEIVGEDRDQTIISFDDNPNLIYQPTGKGYGTFRTYTLKVEGSGITFKNITIENTASRYGQPKGQCVALHTEGDKLQFVNCRILGHQDTIYMGVANTRVYYKDCFIEGTTDFIFGPSTAWFEGCTINNLSNSYITAASTPQEIAYGYVFNHCKVIAAEGVDKCYLGRPWRDYGYTLFMNCELGKHIRPEGWHPWQAERKKTARYYEYNNTGEGATPDKRADWSKQLTKKEAASITVEEVFGILGGWTPSYK